MAPDFATHTLVRIAGAESLLAPDAPSMPDWALSALRVAPWAVVRRAERRARCLPVGIRGRSRSQRLAAWLEQASVLEFITPQMLVQRRSWMRRSRQRSVPALAALDAVESIMAAHGLARAWGPTGSIGFELASGQAAANIESDLDIAVWSEQPLPVTIARALEAQLGCLAVRVDCLLETPRGAVALAEVARASGRCILRTSRGALLVGD